MSKPDGDRLGDAVPMCDFDNPADIEAWFGNYGHFEIYRKVILSNCREIVRASAALNGKKLSEARIDDLARTHGLYLDYLADGLKGRRIREGEVRKSMGGGYQ